MRLPSLPPMPLTPAGGGAPLALWPPLLATRGPGDRSAPHSHHAMHFVLATAGGLRARAAGGSWRKAAGVLTAPDAVHEIDARGVEVLLVFLDPESDVGASLAATFAPPLRPVVPSERDALIHDADPRALLGSAGAAWTARAVRTLGVAATAPRRAVHPRVRKLLRLLATAPPEAPRSLESLAAAVSLSPGRLMHAFTTSIGIPLRPYLAWLKLQRAAGAIVTGAPLTDAAHAAGFADAAHMTRTFRRTFGVAPSRLRPRALAARA